MNKKLDYSNKNIYINSLLSLLYKVFSMILSFFSAPLLLACLGQEKYGIWVTIGSMISWIYYSDLGIGGGLRNKLTTSLAQNDEVASKGYISVSYILLSGISILFWLAFFIIVKFTDIMHTLHLGVDDENIEVCFLVALFLSCLNFVLSLVNNIAYAKQRASLVSFYNLLGQALFVLALFIYYKTGISLIIYVAVAEGLGQVVKNVLSTAYIFKRYPELTVRFSDADKKYSKGILSFGILVFIGQISSLLHNTTDNLLISYLFGAADVTPYNFCYKYFGMIGSIYLVILTPLLSAYTAANAVEDNKWMIGAMKKSTLLYLLFLIGTVLAMFIFQPFSDIWLGQRLDYSIELIAFTAIYHLMLMLSHNTTSLQTGIGDLKWATVAVAIGAILNIPASILCAKTFELGVSGIVLGSVISMIPVLMVGIYKFVYYFKEFTK